MSVDWDTLVVGPCTETFGDPVIYVSATGGPLTGITGVFDAAYLDLNPIGGAAEQLGAPGNITTSRPVLGVQVSQFPPGYPPAQGDRVTVITGQLYAVREVRPDNHGAAKLMLSEAS